MTQAAKKHVPWTCAAALAFVACGESDRTSKVDELMSAAQVESAKPVPTERKPEFDKLPEMTIDELGAYIGGFRAANLDKPEGKKKLAEIVGALPIKEQQVDLRVVKKAKMVDVVEVVRALGRAGAPTVLIKTDARDELGTELLVTPSPRVKEDPKACSICAMVNDKADTGVWSYSGGMGKRHRKGFAGPDLSGTQEAIEKDMARCESEMAFFSAAYNMPWEHGFAMGALIRKADVDKKIRKLVMLGDEAVPGRAVTLVK